MFNLTKEIKLETKDEKIYQKFQISLYLIAFFVALYLSYLIIFPSKHFIYSFLDPTSGKNNLSTPISTTRETLSAGNLSSGNELFFNSDVVGDYSKAVANIYLNMASENPESATLSARKSYQAFMYPQGPPLGWRSGSLLKSSGDYYIVSDSNLRKFASAEIPFLLGYTDASFQETSADKLIYNSRGQNVTANDAYVNGSLFRIDDNYYIMSDQHLEKFVSDRAYLSKYDPPEAITRDVAFLSQYPIANDLVGFSDGTLLANGDSVFIVSNGKILPIDNAQTFESKGYDWNNILNVGADEIAVYQKDKLFNIKSPHPDGTIFKTAENDTYYMIENGQKHSLPSAAIATSWSKKRPVTVSEKALEIYARCNLKKSFWNTRRYSCEIPLDQLSALTGFSYEYSLSANTNLRLDTLNIDYRKNVTKTNLKIFLLGLYNSIKGNYAPNPTS